MKSIWISLGIVIPALASQAEARFFAYTFGAQCCVDHYHYFRCSTSRAIGRGTCAYRGYFTPRYCDSGFYSLYGCSWSPQNHRSPGYSCCAAWDGCCRSWFGFGCRSDGCHGPNQARGSWCQQQPPGPCFPYRKAIPIPQTGPAHAGPCPPWDGCPTGSSHLYDMLFDLPAHF